MDDDDDALVEEQREQEPAEGAPDGFNDDQFDDAEDEADDEQPVHAEPTDEQILAQQCDSTPIKFKQTKGRRGAKQDKLIEITKATDNVEGVISAVAMGSRNEPFFHIVFDERSQAEAFFDRKAYPVQLTRLHGRLGTLGSYLCQTRVEDIGHPGLRFMEI